MILFGILFPSFDENENFLQVKLKFYSGYNWSNERYSKYSAVPNPKLKKWKKISKTWKNNNILNCLALKFPQTRQF